MLRRSIVGFNTIAILVLLIGVLEGVPSALADVLAGPTTSNVQVSGIIVSTSTAPEISDPVQRCLLLDANAHSRGDDNEFPQWESSKYLRKGKS